MVVVMMSNASVYWSSSKTTGRENPIALRHKLMLGAFNVA